MLGLPDTSHDRFCRDILIWLLLTFGSLSPGPESSEAERVKRPAVNKYSAADLRRRTYSTRGVTSSEARIASICSIVARRTCSTWPTLCESWARFAASRFELARVRASTHSSYVPSSALAIDCFSAGTFSHASLAAALPPSHLKACSEAAATRKGLQRGPLAAVLAARGSALARVYRC